MIQLLVNLHRYTYVFCIPMFLVYEVYQIVDILFFVEFTLLCFFYLQRNFQDGINRKIFPSNLIIQKVSKIGVFPSHRKFPSFLLLEKKILQSSLQLSLFCLQRNIQEGINRKIILLKGIF